MVMGMHLAGTVVQLAMPWGEIYGQVGSAMVGRLDPEHWLCLRGGALGIHSQCAEERSGGDGSGIDG